jgi:hypothetical protein
VAFSTIEPEEAQPSPFDLNTIIESTAPGCSLREWQRSGLQQPIARLPLPDCLLMEGNYCLWRTSRGSGSLAC